MSKMVPVKKTESICDELQKMHDRIMGRAFELSLDNGGLTGDLDNWLAAERELIWKPAIELWESDNQFIVTVEMPGVEAARMKVEVTPEDLLVTAETREERKEEDKKEKVYSSELKTGSLFRSITFPKKVSADKVKAELKNGVLTVTAPVAEELTARKVEIAAA